MSSLCSSILLEHVANRYLGTPFTQHVRKLVLKMAGCADSHATTMTKLRATGSPTKSKPSDAGTKSIGWVVNGLPCQERTTTSRPLEWVRISTVCRVVGSLTAR